MILGRRSIDKLYKRRDRYPIPEWQRDKVWSLDKKQALIDTILRGWKLPKFYLNQISEAPDVFEVVDGQQRLATIFEFLDGELRLSQASAEEFGSDTYEGLPDDAVDAFDDYEIEFDIITDADDDELNEFFQRLQEGLPLTASEKLNAAAGNLTVFCRKLSKRPLFAEGIGLRDTRKAHFDVVSKVAAIEIEGLGVGLRYKDLEGVFLGQANFSEASNVAARLLQTFDLLQRVFESERSLLRNRSILQSFATFAARFVEHGKAKGIEPRLLKFYKHFLKELSVEVEHGTEAVDGDYLMFQKTLSANVKTGARTRHEILLRKAFTFDPKFADDLGLSELAQSGLGGKVQELGGSVAKLIGGVNAHYLASDGAEMFTTTNRTTKALLDLGKLARNYEAYGRFVDSLYFIFHESINMKLDQRPDSFRDVSDLRTELRHDLAQPWKGDPVIQKRKRLGATFSRYSGGAVSPEVVSPERFPLIQVNLLEGLYRDLREMSQLAESGKAVPISQGRARRVGSSTS
jgi:Protein of unknown function DUF262